MSGLVYEICLGCAGQVGLTDAVDTDDPPQRRPRPLPDPRALGFAFARHVQDPDSLLPDPLTDLAGPGEARVDDLRPPGLSRRRRSGCSRRIDLRRGEPRCRVCPVEMLEADPLSPSKSP